jgi:rare lipoprotein A
MLVVNQFGPLKYAQHSPLQWVLMLCVALLAGCSSRFSSDTTYQSSADQYQASRYSIKQDRAPDTVLDGHVIKTVVPIDEPRSPGGNKSPYTVRGSSYTIVDRPEGWTQSGVASWYGAKFHGHKTSNGEIFDMYQVSAAHKTLPIPTYILVTNLDNGKSVVARVNDRGPFHGGRVLDMSYAGAVALGYQSLGTARVRIEVLSAKSSAKPTVTNAQHANQVAKADSVFLQVGAFTQASGANEMAAAVLKYTKWPVFVETGSYYRVKVGPMSENDAEKLQKTLKKARLGNALILH